MRAHPYNSLLPHSAVESPQQQTPLALPEHRSGTYTVAKHAIDRVLAFAAVVVLSPVFCLIALIIKINDGGPVFFSQTRVGHNQQPFKMYKFRTMRTDAEAVLPEIIEEAVASESRAGNEVMFKLKDDPRITRPGKFLRQFSLDELPQFFNVLNGSMSLIGPRPPLPREVERFDQLALHKFDVKPGLTGLWQTMGRSNLSWEEAIKLDLYYVNHHSFTMDFKIFFRTFKAVLSRDGAY